LNRDRDQTCCCRRDDAEIKEVVIMVHRIEAPESAPGKPAVEHRYEEFLEQLSVKGRASIQKHDEQCDALPNPRQIELWRRLAGGLAKLARHSPEVFGQNSVKFHIPDGKYKVQVFALEDMRQGTIVLYIPDILQLAVRQKILSASTAPHQHKVPGGAGILQFTPIDAETRDLTVCKAMVGWGRHALRVELGEQTPEEHIQAVERMCELAAQKWAEPQT
jgi:hypothetical protein